RGGRVALDRVRRLSDLQVRARGQRHVQRVAVGVRRGSYLDVALHARRDRVDLEIRRRRSPASIPKKHACGGLNGRIAPAGLQREPKPALGNVTPPSRVLAMLVATSGALG